MSVRPSDVDPGVSPELVLVDPALADDERRRLRAPADTLDRLRAVAPERNGHGVAVPVSDAPRSVAPEPPPAPVEPAPVRPPEAHDVETRGLPGRRPRLRLAAATGGVLALVVAAVLALTSIVSRDGGSAVDTTASTVATSPSGAGKQAPPSKPAGGEAGVDGGRGSQPRRAGTGRATPGRRSAGPSTQVPAAGVRRLAWAPVAEASAYHVELFDGRSRVFSADTRRPQIVVPASWQLEGRTYRLASGEYRWYVWPVVSGRRAAQAIVQARLDVPR